MNENDEAREIPVIWRQPTCNGCDWESYEEAQFTADPDKYHKCMTCGAMPTAYVPARRLADAVARIIELEAQCECVPASSHEPANVPKP